MKRVALAFFLFLFVAGVASAQWGPCTQGPANSQCIAQNVGIASNGDATWPLTLGGSLAIKFATGTPTPYFPFIIWGNGGNSTFLLLRVDSNNAELQSYVNLRLADGGGTSRIYLPAYVGDAYFNHIGKFGIGTTTPNSLFTVAAQSGTTRVAIGKGNGSDVDGRVLLTYDTVNAIGGLDSKWQNNPAPFTIDGSFINVNTSSNGQVVMGPGGAHLTDRLTVNGNIYVTGNVNAKYQDVAEWVPATEPMRPGTVVIVDSGARNTVAPSDRAYDTRVAGVVSAQPGFILGEVGSSKEKIATTGRVKVRVTAAAGPIRAGDLLVTSDRAGEAMRSEPIDVAGVKIHRPGTLIGKALEPLDAGEGEILVLLSLQ